MDDVIDDIDDGKKSTKKKTVKAGPGRPPKSPKVPPKPKLGILDEPDEPAQYAAFLYDTPLVFKKILGFFKLMFVSNIHMIFMKDSILIYCKGHKQKNTIRVRIDCSKATKYFCKKELEIGLSCKNLELVMNTIDKNCDSILFLSTENNIHKNIEIVLTNSLKIEERHKIELIGEYSKSLDENKFQDDDYTIKFKLSGKYFKKMVSDIKSFSEQVSIVKDGPNEKLTFEYTKTDKKINSYHIIQDKNLVNLRDNLGENDTFRASIKVADIKPISAAVLTDSIEIYADENKPLKFINEIDDAIQIITLTDIIDNRLPIL